MMYGFTTRDANSFSSAFFSAADRVSNFAFKASTSFKTMPPRINTARMPAVLLQMPIILIRCAALSSGPSTVIFDSVYVFAFYTDEITVSGGPMGIHGLPGMILGITIPRMFTSWIATKLEVNGVKTNIITPPTKGKKRPAEELKQNIEKVSKDWGTWGRQSIWNIFI